MLYKCLLWQCSGCQPLGYFYGFLKKVLLPTFTKEIYKQMSHETSFFHHLHSHTNTFTQIFPLPNGASWNLCTFTKGRNNLLRIKAVTKKQSDARKQVGGSGGFICICATAFHGLANYKWGMRKSLINLTINMTSFFGEDIFTIPFIKRNITMK